MNAACSSKSAVISSHFLKETESESNKCVLSVSMCMFVCVCVCGCNCSGRIHFRIVPNGAWFADYNSNSPDYMRAAVISFCTRFDGFIFVLELALIVYIYTKSRKFACVCRYNNRLAAPDELFDVSFALLPRGRDVSFTISLQNAFGKFSG